MEQPISIPATTAATNASTRMAATTTASTTIVETPDSIFKIPTTKPSMMVSFDDAGRHNNSASEDGGDGSDTDPTKEIGLVGTTTEAEDRLAVKEAEKKEIEAMARRETMNLRAWRLILLMVMFCTGAMVSTGTFLYIRQQQREESIASYKLFTETIRSASEAEFNDFWSAQRSLGQVITAAGINSGSTFPFVRVPMFEIPASHAREFSGVRVVSWSPIVLESEREQWSEFVQAQQGWYDESIYLSAYTEDQEPHAETDDDHHYDTTSDIRDYIWRGEATVNGTHEVAPAGGPFAPVWHSSPPPPSRVLINYDVLSNPNIANMVEAVRQLRYGLVTRTDTTLYNAFHTHHRNRRRQVLSIDEYHDAAAHKTHPHSTYVQPIFDGLDVEHSKLVGFLSSVVAWDFFLQDLLPDGVSGIVAVLRNTCNESFTYEMHGTHADFVGEGDFHDPNYDSTTFAIPLITHSSNDTSDVPGHCVYSYHLYYSDNFQSGKESNLEIIGATIIATIFAVMAAAFFMYDRFVYRRNTKIVGAAATSNAFISTLFPSEIRKRLLEEEEEDVSGSGKRNKKGSVSAETLVNSGDNDDEETKPLVSKSRPIADLYTETTILFADIAGFSAWSSVREPSQVFILLETLFQAFDEIAKKYRVFKVETVGDCYVAVSGVPDARKDHAVVMAKFARECMARMRSLARKLEVTFGPDTGDLAMRMGMHSGPVTAGVLRGDRSRFQLFGETMNIASKMEQHGLRDKIQLSQETADLIIAAGKSKWVTPREDVIYTKGKGEVQTFWLAVASAQSSDTSSQKESTETDESFKAWEDDAIILASKHHDSRTVRLMKWCEDTLVRLLKHIVARRSVFPPPVSERIPPNESRSGPSTSSLPSDEIKESISLSRFAGALSPEDIDNVSLDPMVVKQLRAFIDNIASAYLKNPFHNFEHANHVAMSVLKLMNRILDPVELKNKPGKDAAEMLHNHTYGIASDPLVQFSCVFAAIIHDVGHPGVPNSQLVEEQNELATHFNNRSVAEQNSINIAWKLLFQKEYALLRRTIFATDNELIRFRQLVVNSVMATDLFDIDLKTSRLQRWERAFSPMAARLTSNDMLNRKATIVIEHLLQASDVSHTMQHWHVYRKWNEKFFLECYGAYIEGRASKNPADDWYEGEIAFFDFYIIPLAHKLKECEVFGVSSDEYLNYAVRNRQEWEKRGRAVVEEMVARVSQSSVKRQVV